MQNSKSILLYISSILAILLYIGYLIYNEPVSFRNIISLQNLFLIGYGATVLLISLIISLKSSIVVPKPMFYFSVLYLISILSIVWASDMSLAASGIYFSVIPFLFIFITPNIAGYLNWKMFLIATAIIMSILIIMTWIAYGSVRFVLPINTNTAVFGILPGLPFLINSYYQSNSLPFKLSSVAFVILIIISLILTKSRTPLFIIVFFLLFTSIIDHNKICGWGITYSSRRCLLIIPPLVVLLLVFTPGIFERYVNSTIQLWEGINTLFTAESDETGVVSRRAKVYFASYNLLQSPDTYLRGVGYNNFSVYMGTISNFPRMNPHNFSLRILMETGVLGFICFILGVASAAKAYISKIMSDELGNKEKSKYVSGLWGLAFVLLLSLFNPLLLDPIFFILLSLPYVITQEARHTTEG